MVEAARASPGSFDHMSAVPAEPPPGTGAAESARLVAGARTPRP
ncbi:hypothetical protein AB0B78_27230 [Streptomyces sp. NPDC040724]